MRRPLVPFTALTASLLAALAACGGPAHVAPRVQCVLAGQPPALVYPAGGAGAAPDGNFTLVLTRADAPVSLALGSQTLAANLAAAAVPSPLPSPHATFAPNDTLAGYAVPALQPHTTYTVLAPVTPSGCFASPPPPAQAGIGSFTTQ